MTHSFEQDAQYAPQTSGGQKSPQRSSANKKKRHKKQRVRTHTSPQVPLTYTNVLKQFIACSRCSTLLAGYRLLHGAAPLEQAIANQQDGWLTLQWDKQTRELLHKIYDVRIEGDSIYLDMSCEECQRRFSYKEKADGSLGETFQVDLKL